MVTIPLEPSAFLLIRSQIRFPFRFCQSRVAFSSLVTAFESVAG